MSGSAFFEVREEIAFPCEVVSIQDKPSGKMVSVSKPVGYFCIRCDSGTSQGLPYFEKEDLHVAVLESPALKELCVEVVEAYHSDGAEATVCAGECVHSIEDSRDTLRVIYDAYERNDFISNHEGATPEELYVDPVACEHPRTNEPLTLFPAEAKPHFQFICDYALGTTREQNRMLQPVYQQQGRHTFDFFKTRLPSSLRSARPPPARSTMLTKMKELAAKRNPNLRQSAVKSEMAGANTPRNLGFVHTPSPVARASSTFFPPRAPTVGVTAKDIMNFRVAPRSGPTCAKSAPPTPAKNTAGTAHAASMAAAPPGPVKFVVSQNPAGNSEVKQEVAAKPAALPLKRPSESTEAAGDAKQQKAIVNSEAVVASQAKRSWFITGVGPTAPTKVGVSGTPWVDLAKVIHSSPTASPEKKEGNKFENCLKPLNLIRVLRGDNIEKDTTSARRMLGFAKRESPHEWAPRIEERLNYVAGCKEVVRSRILARNKLDPVIALIERVQPAFTDGRLPLMAWSDWVCSFEAFKYLKPYKAKSELLGLLKALELYSSTNQKGTYCHTNPTWFLEHIPEQERIDGIVAERFVDFMESVVIPGQVKCGIPGRGELAEFLCAIVATIDGFPPPYRTSKVLEPFRTRVLGALCALGRVPFLAGNSSVHAQALMSEHKNALLLALQAVEWTNNLLGSVFMSCIGEKEAWPAVEDQVKALGSSSDASAGFAVLEEIFTKYPVWAAQCRDGALERRLHPAVLQWCQAFLEGKRITIEATQTVSFDCNDATVITLLKHLRKCKQLSWTDVSLDRLLTQLSPVAASLRKMDDQANVVAVCAIDKGQLTSSSDEQFHTFAAKLESVLPARKGNSVLLTGQCRQQVLDTLIAFGEVLLQRWPCPAAYPCVVALQQCFEIDMSAPLEGEPEFDLKELVEQMRTNFSAFRRMQGFALHLEETLKLGDFNDASATGDSISKMLQKLNLYSDYFRTDERFLCLKLSSDVDSKLQAKIDASASVVSKFKAVYHPQSEEIAVAETAKLREMAGGAPNGASWYGECDAALCWGDFCKATESNLRAVDRVALFTKIATVDQVAKP